MTLDLHTRLRIERDLRHEKARRATLAPFLDRHLVGLDDVTPVPFHIGQLAAWESSARFTVISSGTQGGKTGFIPWWLNREIYGSTDEGYEGCGAGDYVAATSTYDLFKLKLLPSLLRVFVDILKVGRYWGGDRVIELKDPTTNEFRAERSTDPMWGRIILRSADSPGGLESGTIKAAILDEAGQPRFTISAWRAIRRRLSLNIGKVLIASTLYDLGWIKELFLDAVQDGIDPLPGIDHVAHLLPNAAECNVYTTTDTDYTSSIRVIQFDSIVNPVFDPSEFAAARATMPDDEFAMFYRGRAAKLRGQIYDIFSQNTHVIESIPIPTHWPVAIGFDPIGEIIAALYVAWDPDNYVLHVFDEYYEPFGLATSEHVTNILERLRRYAPQIIGLWGGGPSERQSRTDWRAAGLPVDAPPLTDVWVGIRRVYSLLKQGGLLIHSNCTNTIREFGAYRRELDRMGNPTPKIHNKDSFHAMDCSRYVCVGLSTPGEQFQIIPNCMLIGG